MKELSLTCFLIAIILFSGCTQKSGQITPVVDHHMHIRSQSAAKILSEFQSPKNDTVKATSADDAIRLLDSAGIEKGTLLSLAYFYGMPDINVKNEYAKVRAENNYVSSEAAKFSGRLYAFCSVNPLAEYAIEEINRCADHGGFTGLKLHFGNSDVDLRNDDHLQQVGRVFREADNLKFPVVVHMWTRHKNYGKRDAKIFLNDVLARVPDLTVQIAHLGGAGLFSASTDSLMGIFESAVKSHPEVMDEDITFDLGAAAANPELAFATGDSTKAKVIQKRNRMLVEQVQEIGPEYFVFGSDWWARNPVGYVELLRSLSLNRKQLSTLLTNTAPYVK